MTEAELLLHVKKGGKLLMTPERANLLEIIDETGSLLNASKQIGVSYNKVWTMLNELNEASMNPLVTKLRGGKGGGGAQVTESGKLVLKEYRLLENEVQKFLDRLNSEINF